MGESELSFDHIHIISGDPRASAAWYVGKLGAEINGEIELRGAPQINVSLGGMTLLIRGRRSGEDPSMPAPMRDFEDYSSHDEYGTDHFGFTYRGDLRAYCEVLRNRGVEFVVEPWEFIPGSGGVICYIAAPDGVSIELIQARPR